MGYKNLCHASKFEPPHGNLKTNLQEIIFFFKFLFSFYLHVSFFSTMEAKPRTDR